jgi:hypothetical protein
MKMIYILLASFAVISIQAQSTQSKSNAPVAAPSQIAPAPATQPATSPAPSEMADPALQAQIDRYAPRATLVLREPKPNEIDTKRFTFSGILVQIGLTDNLLQLINPAAPAEYGTAEDNLLRDPIRGQPSGLKLFAIQF